MELGVNEEILMAYGFTYKTIKIQQIGSGHINRTYLLYTHAGANISFSILIPSFLKTLMPSFYRSLFLNYSASCLKTRKFYKI